MGPEVEVGVYRKRNTRRQTHTEGEKNIPVVSIYNLIPDEIRSSWDELNKRRHFWDKGLCQGKYPRSPILEWHRKTSPENLLWVQNKLGSTTRRVRSPSSSRVRLTVRRPVTFRSRSCPTTTPDVPPSGHLNNLHHVNSREVGRPHKRRALGCQDPIETL